MPTLESLKDLSLSRETRSTHIPGNFVVADVDEQNEVIWLQCASPAEQVRFERRSRIALASGHGQYAIARKWLHGEPLDLPSIEWLQKALENTAEIIRSEGGSASYYDIHAASLESEKAVAKKTLHELIIQLKSDFAEGKMADPQSFFSCYHSITRMSPYLFTPHYSALQLVVTQWANKISKELISNAYEASPVLTFNTMAFRLIRPIEMLSRDENGNFTLAEKVDIWFNEYSPVVLACFPHDISALIIMNKTREIYGEAIADYSEAELHCRNTLAEALANGYTYIKKLNLEAARDAFSIANEYDISDKRSYIFRIIIDILNGDLLSAKKLKKELSFTINWMESDERRTFVAHLIRQISNKPPKMNGYSKQMACEIPVIEALISLQEAEGDKAEIFDTFIDRLKHYLTHPSSELIWADFVLTAVERIVVESKKLHETSLLHGLDLSIHAAFRLRDVDPNFQEYSEFYDFEKRTVTPPIIWTYPKQESAAAVVSPESLNLDAASLLSFQRDILWKRLNSLLFALKQNYSSKILLEYLNSITSTDEVPINGPSLKTVIEKLDEAGTLDERIEFFEWASKQSIPEEFTPSMVNALLRWSLDQPIPCLKTQDLNEFGQQWKNRLDEGNYQLVAAYRSWEAVMKGEWDQAKEIVSTFENTRDTAPLDPLAFSVISIVAICLERREIVTYLPKKFLTLFHAQVTSIALMLLARDGAKEPYILNCSDLTTEKAALLARHYFGQRIDEDDNVYLLRIKELPVDDPADLRNSKRIFKEEDESGARWILPINAKLNSRMRLAILAETSIVNDRLIHNKEVKNEKSAYLGNRKFRRWVWNNKSLPTLSSAQLHSKVKKTFPELNKDVKEQFFTLYESKIELYQRYLDLKAKTAPAQKKEMQRFWQLVEMASSSIEKACTSKHFEVDKDIVVKSVKEAYTVKALIFEWGRCELQKKPKEEQSDALSKLCRSFHGPEEHVWRKGPRMAHINAGVFSSTMQKPSDMHIYIC